jgi:hypothetical protein
MRQSWDEQADAQEDYLRHIRRMPSEAYTPHAEMRKWRRRYWWVLAIALLEFLMLLFRRG